MLAWGAIVMSLMFEIGFLFVLTFVGTQANYLTLILIIVGAMSITGFLFPYNRIIKANAAYCVDKSLDAIQYLRKFKGASFSFASFFLTGGFAAAFLILAPFCFLPIH